MKQIIGDNILITQDQLPMVAIPSMNDMHLEEMLIINKLESAARANKVDEVLATIKELLAHTEIHYANENELMAKVDFPEFAVHKAEHDRHLKELTSLVKYFSERGESNAILAYIEGNLIGWSLHHVETMDADMAKYVTEATK